MAMRKAEIELHGSRVKRLGRLRSFVRRIFFWKKGPSPEVRHAHALSQPPKDRPIVLDIDDIEPEMPDMPQLVAHTKHRHHHHY